MDPNNALALIRALCQRVDETDGPMSESYASDLVATIQGLDEWLSKGGFLPHEWTKSTAGSMATITYRYGDKEVTAYVPPF